MSQERAVAEIDRFLSSSDPEVLSISGRWGVGKTHAWDMALKAKRANTPLRRYAYVSAFGLRSLDELKMAIVQSTVSLEGNELEPTVESLVEHVSSIAGLRKLGEAASRKGLGFLGRGAAIIPYAGRIADFLAPGSVLLIRNQIICIDDIERAGQGLDVADILGLVSSLRERRKCKIVLLLNEDGLGDQGQKYREYLEKVVDQSIKFEPTPQESATAALDPRDPLALPLRARIEALGITNIRVIRRIRRFLSFIEPQLTGLHHGVTESVIHSIALLGWCVFEPKLAPDLERVRRFNRFSSLFSEDERPVEEKRLDQVIHNYGFAQFDEVDSVILDGLEAGAFDSAALQASLEVMHSSFAKDSIRQAIAKPWNILGDSFENNDAEFLNSLIETMEKYASAMMPSEASDALAFLREMGRADEAERLLAIYIKAQDSKPREFFASVHDGRRRPIDEGISAAFRGKLDTMPLIRDPAQILLEIGSKRAWNPADVAYLATISIDDYEAMLKKLRGPDLQSVIAVALRFGEMNGNDENDREVGKRMTEALRRIARQGQLNRMRIRPYLKEEPENLDGEQPQTTSAQTEG